MLDLLVGIMPVKRKCRPWCSYMRLGENITLRNFAFKMPDGCPVWEDTLAHDLFNEIHFLLQVFCRHRSHVGRIPNHNVIRLNTSLPIVGFHIDNRIVERISLCNLFVERARESLMPSTVAYANCYMKFFIRIHA